jgi:hypothetical protein
MGGAIFETAVLSEIARTITNRGEEPRLYFWRTSAGVEVDFLVETRGMLVPIEVKLSSTPSPTMAAGIRALRGDLRDRAGSGYVGPRWRCAPPLGALSDGIPFADCRAKPQRWARAAVI